MKYDFTTIINREGKDALAVDKCPIAGVTVKEGFDKIPMWVADMNFATVPTVMEAMKERIEHPCFGYFIPREEYFSSISPPETNTTILLLNGRKPEIR